MHGALLLNGNGSKTGQHRHHRLQVLAEGHHNAPISGIEQLQYRYQLTELRHQRHRQYRAGAIAELLIKTAGAREVELLHMIRISDIDHLAGKSGMTGNILVISLTIPMVHRDGGVLDGAAAGATKMNTQATIAHNGKLQLGAGTMALHHIQGATICLSEGASLLQHGLTQTGYIVLGRDSLSHCHQSLVVLQGYFAGQVHCHTAQSLWYRKGYPREDSIGRQPQGWQSGCGFPRLLRFSNHQS